MGLFINGRVWLMLADTGVKQKQKKTLDVKAAHHQCEDFPYSGLSCLTKPLYATKYKIHYFDFQSFFVRNNNRVLGCHSFNSPLFQNCL